MTRIAGTLAAATALVALVALRVSYAQKLESTVERLVGTSGSPDARDDLHALASSWEPELYAELGTAGPAQFDPELRTPCITTKGGALAEVCARPRATRVHVHGGPCSVDERLREHLPPRVAGGVTWMRQLRHRRQVATRAAVSTIRAKSAELKPTTAELQPKKS